MVNVYFLLVWSVYKVASGILTNLVVPLPPGEWSVSGVKILGQRGLTFR